MQEPSIIHNTFVLERSYPSPRKPYLPPLPTRAKSGAGSLKDESTMYSSLSSTSASEARNASSIR